MREREILTPLLHKRLLTHHDEKGKHLNKRKDQQTFIKKEIQMAKKFWGSIYFIFLKQGKRRNISVAKTKKDDVSQFVGGVMGQRLPRLTQSFWRALQQSRSKAFTMFIHFDANISFLLDQRARIYLMDINQQLIYNRKIELSHIPIKRE